ncbi:response regulator transcription factor [Tanticharoenia sakaeratensis]|nr:response regulator transcription factor [Tanticharoenia sakaeratensis]
MRLMILLKNAAMARDAERALHTSGFMADIFDDMDDAREALASNEYDLILRTRYVGSADGIDWLRQRAAQACHNEGTFVIMVTDNEDDRILALESGADDSVCSNINPRELVARVRAVLRRPRGTIIDLHQYEDLTLCKQSREVRVSGALLPLQRRETDVLEALLRRQGRVVSRSGLEHDVYGAHAAYCPNSLEVRVSRIRRQLMNADSSLTIETVRGVGYRLVSREAAGARACVARPRHDRVAPSASARTPAVAKRATARALCSA